MNATSRAILQTVLNTDTALMAGERRLLEQIVEGRAESSEIRVEGRQLLLTQKAAAEMLSVSRVTVWRMTKEGLLHPVEILPEMWRYSYAEVARLAASGVHGRNSGPLKTYRSAVAA